MNVKEALLSQGIEIADLSPDTRAIVTVLYLQGLALDESSRVAAQVGSRVEAAVRQLDADLKGSIRLEVHVFGPVMQAFTWTRDLFAGAWRGVWTRLKGDWKVAASTSARADVTVSGEPDDA